MKNSTSFRILFSDLVLMSTVLLEQAGPIANSYQKRSNLGWALAPFLLMVLVLSNAYKNENVTKITLPRTLIPVDTFDKLVHYNFSLFSRAVSLGGYKSLASTAGVFIGYLIVRFIGTGIDSKSGRSTGHDGYVFLASSFTRLVCKMIFLICTKKA